MTDANTSETVREVRARAVLAAWEAAGGDPRPGALTPAPRLHPVPPRVVNGSFLLGTIVGAAAALAGFALPIAYCLVMAVRS